MIRTSVELPVNKVGEYYDELLEQMIGKRMKELRNEENPVEVKVNSDV